LDLDCSAQLVGSVRAVRCPWHGKKLQAIARIARDGDHTGETAFCQQPIRLIYDGETLNLTALSPSAATA
jgi:hypothetical protein